MFMLCKEKTLYDNIWCTNSNYIIIFGAQMQFTSIYNIALYNFRAGQPFGSNLILLFRLMGLILGLYLKQDFSNMFVIAQVRLK